MATETCVEILPGDLAQIVESVFGAMLSLEVHPGGSPWRSGANRMTGAVHLTGAWNGAVLVECDPDQACRFAARFLGMEPSEVAEDVVRAVIGELANMIGGNLKCIVAPGIQLSTPSVLAGSDYRQQITGAELHERLAFRCAEGTFWITLLRI